MADPEPTWKDWLQQHDPTGLFELPVELADNPWRPTDKDREAAWVIYIQLRTRISTQALHYRSGDEETALDSLYQLFGIVRDTIGDNGGFWRRRYAPPWPIGGQRPLIP